jgi:hypothetical protein
METIDIVIPYVNNQDISWQNEFHRHNKTNGDKNERRFRDTNVFNYWFRAIENTLKFNYRIVLVLASEQQCPAWLNKDNVTIVYHRDFIPHTELPTFNSSVINCYLPFITGLNNRYILYNDDMFNLKELHLGDFYQGDKPILHYERNRKFNPATSTWDANIAKCQDILNTHFKCKHYICPEHCPLPHIKSLDLFIWSRCNDIMRTALQGTPFRMPKNITDWFYQMFYLYMGAAINRPTSLSHYYNTENISIPTEKMACYNDTERIKDFQLYTSNLRKILNSLFPNKSKYEV